MFKLVIGDKEYEAPETLQVSQYSQAARFDVDNESQRAAALAWMFNCEVSELQQASEELLELGAAFYKSLIHPILFEGRNEIEGHKLLLFNEMTLGQWIDLEHALDSSMTLDMFAIVQVLYSVSDPSEWSLRDVYQPVMSYLNWRSQIYGAYKRLFNSEDPKPESESQRPKTPAAKIWYDIVMVLAGGRFLDIDSVTDRKVIECFNWLAWNKDQQRKLQQQRQ